MASIDWRKNKAKGSSAWYMLGHSARYDGADKAYKNKYIDTSKSTTNECVVWEDSDVTVVRPWGDKGAFEEVYAQFEDRIKAIDSKEPPKRVRADRVTSISFTVPLPDGIPEEREEEFFQMVYEEITGMCGGAANVTPMYIHRDEVHDYVDPTTHEVTTSKVHAHVTGIPYVKGVGVNASKFMTRQRMSQLNRVVGQRCRTMFGVDFNTGKGKGADTEDLMAESQKLADLKKLQQQERDQKTKIVVELQNRKDLLESTKALQKEHAELKEKNAELNAENLKLKEENTKIQEQASLLLKAFERLKPFVAELERAKQKSIKEAYEGLKQGLGGRQAPSEQSSMNHPKRRK